MLCPDLLFSHNHLNAKLIVFSQVPLKNCPEEWQKNIKNTKSEIEFVEGTFSKNEIFSSGDVYLYPSRLDGIGLTLPEAISFGKPAITTNSPPMNEFVVDGYNGKLIDVMSYRGRPDGYYWAESIIDENDYLDKINYFLEHEHEIVKYSANCFEFSKQELDWGKNSEYLNAWIREVTKIEIQETELNSIIKSSGRYDRVNSPMPLQRLLLSAKGMVASLFKRYSLRR